MGLRVLAIAVIREHSPISRARLNPAFGGMSEYSLLLNTLIRKRAHYPSIGPSTLMGDTEPSKRKGSFAQMMEIETKRASGTSAKDECGANPCWSARLADAAHPAVGE
jgi:hypothetical protein